MKTKQQPIRGRLDFTEGDDNDRIVPWRIAAIAFPLLLTVTSVGWWPLHAIGMSGDGWTNAPIWSCVFTVGLLSGNTEDGSRLRHQAQAIAIAAVTFVVAIFASLPLFPTLGLLHRGPVRAALVVASALVAIAAFTATNHMRPRPKPEPK